MASIQEKLADSLAVLKEYQERTDGAIIHGQNALGTTHTRRLVQNGYLEQIIKGWYMCTFPGMEGDTTAWYVSYWSFIASYSNSRFGDQWCLTPEESLDFYAGCSVVPRQLIIRSPKAANNVVALKHDDTLLDITATIPETTIVEPKYGLRLYPLASAIVACSPAYYIKSAVNARTCLFMLGSAEEILKEVVDEGNTSRAGRIVGALRNVGRDDMADTISNMMTSLGYNIRPEDPFDEMTADTIKSCRTISPHAIRIRLMWDRMREQILSLGIREKSSLASADKVLADMDDNYARDSYHSLSIEGYRVTEGLIERVRSGEWNPKDDKQDADRKNALAARGYYQAFLQVKESVKAILEGGKAGEVVAGDFQKWHFEMFQPCITAGIIKPSDLIGYRTGQVYVRGSKHTPFSPDAVRDAMPVLIEAMQTEPDAAVRAILGHFFFVYIHPFMDGNGRTARFIMNTMLVTGGYPWRIITVEERDRYMAALEKASIEGDVRDFAQIVLSGISHQ